MANLSHQSSRTQRSLSADIKEISMEKSEFVNGFEGHLSPSTGWYKNVFTNGLIVLDTNVLLDLYRMQTEARDAIIDVLQKTRERLWIPAQVRKEFWTNRAAVISESLNISSTYGSSFEKEIRNAQKVVREWANRVSVSTQDSESLITKLDEVHAEAQSLMKSSASNVNEQWIREPHTDAVLSKIARLLHGRIGSGFDKERTKNEIAEFDRRAKESVPPGFKDAGKSKGDPHGDYFIWRELLDYVSGDPVDVLFITGDSKSDWQREVRGQKIGPLPELVHEFMNSTRSKHRFHLASAAGFLKLAMSHVPSTQITDVVISLANQPSNMRRLEEQWNFDSDRFDDVTLTDGRRRTILQKFALVLQERYFPIFKVLSDSLLQDGVVVNHDFVLIGTQWKDIEALAQEMELILEAFAKHRNLKSHELGPWRMESTSEDPSVIGRFELTPWFAEAIEKIST